MKGANSGCNASKLMWALLLIGGLNWGLVGLGGFFGGDWNVVTLIFGSWDWLVNLIYVLVGVAAVMTFMGGCKCGKCKMKGNA